MFESPLMVAVCRGLLEAARATVEWLLLAKPYLPGRPLGLPRKLLKPVNRNAEWSKLLRAPLRSRTGLALVKLET